MEFFRAPESSSRPQSIPTDKIESIELGSLFLNEFFQPLQALIHLEFAEARYLFNPFRSEPFPQPFQVRQGVVKGGNPRGVSRTDEAVKPLKRWAYVFQRRHLPICVLKLCWHIRPRLSLLGFRPGFPIFNNSLLTLAAWDTRALMIRQDGCAN